ncbi:hypothetical protein ACKP2L_04710 [Oenococcus alcoholitolerans]|uniref:hypothetical protein n=1 Tax=Oenococcus alcoholitolerans TaxID=931074 RepID=UPI003F71A10A
MKDLIDKQGSVEVTFSNGKAEKISKFELTDLNSEKFINAQTFDGKNIFYNVKNLAFVSL